MLYSQYRRGYRRFHTVAGPVRGLRVYGAHLHLLTISNDVLKPERWGLGKEGASVNQEAPSKGLFERQYEKILNYYLFSQGIKRKKKKKWGCWGRREGLEVECGAHEVSLWDSREHV